MHFKSHLIDFIRYVVEEFVLSNSLQKLSGRRHWFRKHKLKFHNKVFFPQFTTEFTTFHAKRGSTQTYISSFLIMELSPIGEDEIYCIHFATHRFKILLELIMYTHTQYTRSYKENNKIKKVNLLLFTSREL